MVYKLVWASFSSATSMTVFFLIFLPNQPPHFTRRAAEPPRHQPGPLFLRWPSVDTAVLPNLRRFLLSSEKELLLLRGRLCGNECVGVESVFLEKTYFPDFCLKLYWKGLYNVLGQCFLERNYGGRIRTSSYVIFCIANVTRLSHIMSSFETCFCSCACIVLQKAWPSKPQTHRI